MSTLKNGDEVRFIKNGRVVVLEHVNEDPNYAANGEVWAETSAGISYSGWVDKPEDVELVRLAEDIPARSLPSAKEIANYVSSAMHSGFGEDLSFNETDTNEPDGQLLAYGTSATGQPFGCRITISEITETDY